MEENNYELMNDETVVLNPFQCFIGTFVSPEKTFKSLAKKPYILIPLIIIPLMILAYYGFIFDDYKELMLVTLEEQFAKQDVALGQDFIEMQANISSITTLVISPVMGVVGILFGALYYFVAVKIAKGTMKYKSAISLVGHGTLVSILSYLVLIIISVLNGEVQLYSVTSLATLLPTEMEMGFIYGLLLNVDVFAIWKYALIIIGLQHIANLSKKQAFIIVGIAFIFVCLLSGASLGISQLASQL